MARLMEIISKTPNPDVTIQSALREIDTQQLSIAMLGYTDDEKDAVLRNMSKRAAGLLKEEIKAVEDRSPPPFVIEEAMELFNQKLTKYARHFAEDERNTDVYAARYARGEESAKAPSEAPEYRFNSEEAILQSLRDLKRFIEVNGILALDGSESKVENPVIRKALQLLTDGWDPMEMHTILERTKQVYLDRERRLLDMTLDGIDCLASGGHLLALEERLKAHMV
jgi:hypothetical protein